MPQSAFEDLALREMLRTQFAAGAAWALTNARLPAERLAQRERDNTQLTRKGLELTRRGLEVWLTPRARTSLLHSSRFSLCSLLALGVLAPHAERTLLERSSPPLARSRLT